MGPKKEKERIEAEIRKISKLTENKFCIDCNEKMPAYANMSHFTFVCTRCSGLHRELQFKIKGISMSSFTQEDVQALGRGGNARFNAVYMARYNPDRENMQVPTSATDMSRLRDFINQKYTNQKWYSEDGVANAPTPPTQDSRDSFSNATNAGFNNSNNRRTSGSGFTPEPPKQAPAPEPPKRNELLDLFDSPNPAPPQQQQQQQQQQFDPFGSQQQQILPSQSNGFPQQGQTSTNNSFAAFDSQPVQQGGFDAFGSPQPQMHQNAFGAPTQFNQQAFGQPIQPMPFLATKPPESSSEVSAPVPSVVEATKPSLLSIGDAFDDLVIGDTAPPSSNNPFDTVSSGGAVPVPGTLPYNATSQLNQMGMPPQGQQMVYPPQPQHNQFQQPTQHQQQQQQQQPPQMGYGHPPPQMSYGQPPPGQYGQPPPGQYGQPGVYPVPINQPYPGQQQYPPPPHQTTSSSMPQQAQQQAPAPAAAPDPFSAMGGSAWGTVGGKPAAPVIPSYGVATSASAVPSVDNNNPFGGQQTSASIPTPVDSTAADANNPFAAAPAAAPAETPMNPFDMF